MFSGLTNQVSTWMGKKNENGSEANPTEKPASPGLEVNVNLEKKEASPTRGSKLEMLAGVKSQMSGWLSGGIPGLSRGAAAPGENNEAQPGGSADDTQAMQSGEPVAMDHIKDDDASSATGGADSGPASLEGTPTDEKDGSQPFGAVSTKALASAKSLGGFLYSAMNKASKTVVEASTKIKKTVEENRLIAELNKEQEAFIAGKQNDGKGEAVAPWVGAPNEDALREECLSLSTDRRNFVRAPPPGVEFEWDFEAIQPIAQATLALDPNLQNMRFELVPKVITEENFWRNYFYRVSLLRQSYELNAMANQAENNPNENTVANAESIDYNAVDVTTGQETAGALSMTSSDVLADSPGHEFVSDSMRVSDMDLEEVREGMKKMGMQPPKEEDWERELEAELQDYEVVGSGHERIAAAGDSVAASRPATNSVAPNERDEWEKQIDELLAKEDGGDLK